jgi:hypothetical protein
LNKRKLTENQAKDYGFDSKGSFKEGRQNGSLFWVNEPDPFGLHKQECWQDESG